MAQDDELEQAIEKTKKEIQGKRERLEKLERKRNEQTAEEVDLETFEAM